MIRIAVILSWVCLLIAAVASLWVWHYLPELETYPVHWDAFGQPNRFGSKNGVFFHLIITPIIMVFTFIILFFIPKFEPKKTIILECSRIYSLIWIANMMFLTIMHIVVIRKYSFLANGLDTLLFHPFIIMAV